MEHTHAMHIVELRFGRGIGPVGQQVPMDGDRWAAFQRRAVAILDGVAVGLQAETVRVLEQWVELHLSNRGNYRGQEEESAVATLFTNTDTVDGLADLLGGFASELAGEFDQDTVAVVVSGVGTLHRGQA